MAEKEQTWEEFCAAHAPKHGKVYDACMKKAEEHRGPGAVPWIHLADAVERGSVSPLEAYDALSLGYLPAVLTVRESRYSHLVSACGMTTRGAPLSKGTSRKRRG